MYSILHYLDVHGKDHFQDWLDGLRDREAKIAILRRVARLSFGLAGDRHSVRGGIQELRIDVGSGYRVYFAYVGKTAVLLTCGGTKRTQANDIATAIEMFRDWKNRNGKASSFS
ncbi:type II toxin-antitoxin system RelE/ParE family toxin [Duganella sp. FT3S]|uniref:Type II toxin-antitoxin system RelE/ParE family toxin n=1 Tax=Rugamonas fusca TaxID=2758568 RepID=A0A7W2EHZ0_9BURK|nr:type II toxin-antitoxin system RelE/ParE family toxin [Rugamonas fusca]MBA5606238.1 type II toxin-antitoxin system RelE/ParE family toxin [Rugamonas fusca]